MMSEPVTPPPPPPPSPGATKLYRSRNDRVVAGVCGGLGAYLGVDALVLRIAAVIFGVMSAGAAVVAYIVAVVLLPEGDPPAASDQVRVTIDRDRGRLIAGSLLVGLGVLWVVGTVLPRFMQMRIVGPLALIGLGVLLLARTNHNR